MDNTNTNDTENNYIHLQQALEHNLSYQKTIESNILTLKKILIENSEKQRLLKCKICKYDLKKFIGTIRGPKRNDFFSIPHWMFDTMDEDTGTIAPHDNNKDIQIYHQRLPNFKIDHTLLKFSLCEQRQLSKAIANGIRLLYLKDLHKKWRNDTRKLQDELNKIRIKDAKNELWPLNHWKQYTIPWNRIAKEHMQGRTASECKVFWNGHSCLDNPSINRSKTWSKQENKKLKQVVTEQEEKDWIAISMQHDCKRTPLQCAQQWMKKVKPRPKVDRKWTKSEDDQLKELVFKHGKNNFLYIGSFFENRTALQCSSRWLKSTAPYIRSGEWDKVEDVQCVLSHNAYLPKHSPVIRYKMNNRYNPHYRNKSKIDDKSNLNIDDKRNLDLNEEDKEDKEDEDGIDDEDDNDDGKSKKKKKKKHGGSKKKKKDKTKKKKKDKDKKKKKDKNDDKMDDIEGVINDMNELEVNNVIINDINDMVEEKKENEENKMNESNKNGNNSKKKGKSKDNKSLAPRAGKHGVWVLIGRHVTFRNDVKARERYMNVLDPDIDIESKWTPKEDCDLLSYHDEYGDKWALIARKLGTNRTDCYCRQRYKALLKKKKRQEKRNKNMVDLTQFDDDDNNHDDDDNDNDNIIDLDITPKRKNPVRKARNKNNNKNGNKSSPRNTRKRKRMNNNDPFIVPDDDDEYYLDYIEPKKKKQKRSTTNKKKKDKKNNNNNNNEVDEMEDNRYIYNPEMHPIKSSVLDLLPDLDRNIDIKTDEITTTKSKNKKKKKEKKPKSSSKKKKKTKTKTKKNKKPKSPKKKRFKPKYLNTPFCENRPFMGTKPNKFILNQPQIDPNHYIIPTPIDIDKKKKSNYNGYRILSIKNNSIDKFIKNYKPKHVQNPFARSIHPIPHIPSIPLPLTNNKRNNNMTLPSLSGQLPISFISSSSTSSSTSTPIQSNRNQFNSIPIPSFGPKAVLNPFEAASNSVINANTFKISFPLNFSKKPNNTLSAPPQSTTNRSSSNPFGTATISPPSTESSTASEVPLPVLITPQSTTITISSDSGTIISVNGNGNHNDNDKNDKNKKNALQLIKLKSPPALISIKDDHDNNNKNNNNNNDKLQSV